MYLYKMNYLRFGRLQNEKNKKSKKKEPQKKRFRLIFKTNREIDLLFILL
jgi:hypothetical protein